MNGGMISRKPSVLGTTRARRVATAAAIAAAVIAVSFAAWRVHRASAEGVPVTDPLVFAGYLTDGGVPVEGPRDLTVRLYAAESGGTALCTTSATGTTVTAGRFSVTLHPDCAQDVHDEPDIWVEVQAGTTTFPDRLKMGAVPYALEADKASALTVVARREMMGVGEVWNCRLSYDSTSGTLSVVSRDGSPLSAVHPCFFSVGDSEVAEFSFPVSVVLANDSNTFGSTAGRAWGNARPFFLAVCDGSNPGGAINDFFGISLNPVRRSTGSDVAALCKPGDAARCNTQNSLLVMDSDISLAGEINRPCIVIGSFRATKSTSDRWTVIDLAASDGIGRFQEGVRFTMPTGQNGAGVGSYFSASVGTPPSWPGITYYYWVFRTGFVRLSFDTYSGTAGDCTNGSGAGWTMLALPYMPVTQAYWAPAGYIYTVDGGNTGTGTLDIRTSGSTLAYVRDEEGSSIQNNGWQMDSDFTASSVEYHSFSP